MTAKRTSNSGMTTEQYQALVRQIAEKVWQMLRKESQIQAERRGTRDRRTR